MGVSSDVAGATFMAMATCTSELMVSVIGTFLTKSDLGVGNVVGSGVYNTLGVPACTGLAASRAIVVNKWPLLRDSGVYAASIVALAAVTVDNVVVWYEALVLVSMYFGYAWFLFAQNKLAKAASELKNRNSFISRKYKPSEFLSFSPTRPTHNYCLYLPHLTIKISPVSKKLTNLSI